MGRTSGSLRLVLVLVFALVAGAVQAQEPDDSDETPDYLAMASILLSDGHPDRALSVLAEVDREQPGLDLGQFWLLKGIAELRQGLDSAAGASLEAAIAAGRTEPALYLLLAEARARLKDWPGVIEALDGAGELGWGTPEAALLRAAAWREQGDTENAWSALSEGERRFPEAVDIARERVKMLVEMGLYHEAVQQARLARERQATGPDDALALIRALSEAGETDAAVLAGEEARLTYADDTRMDQQLAVVYAGAARPLSAASILWFASFRDAALTEHAAEMYRRAGRMAHALLANGRIADDSARTKQRLDFWVQTGRYERAASLEPRLKRLGLLGEDAVRLALAYALLKTDRLDAAERYLRRIESARAFEAAAELRRIIDSCRRDSGPCL